MLSSPQPTVGSVCFKEPVDPAIDMNVIETNDVMTCDDICLVRKFTKRMEMVNLLINSTGEVLNDLDVLPMRRAFPDLKTEFLL